MRTLADTLSARLTMVVLVVVPFHALITVWLASYFGHYTALRLWKECLLAAIVFLVVWTIARQPTLRERLWRETLFRYLTYVIGAYVLLTTISGLIAYTQNDVTAKALDYGLVSNLRYMAFFMCVLVIACNTTRVINWPRLLLWPAAVVILFGLLQFLVLPHDVLRHVGYGPETIPSYAAVDNKPEYARVQSTLRGANPLGAYLVVVIAALVGLIMTAKDKLRTWYGVLLAISAIVLFATYSRSAYIGAALAAALSLYVLSTRKRQQALMLIMAGLVLLVLSLVVLLRHNDYVQNIFFHTDEKSRSATSSNFDRSRAISSGVTDIVRQPLGRGTGTAGPASVYNDHQGRIAENYYIQIGQETGVLGLGLFVAICGLVGTWLWRLRSQNMLPLVLLASLVGISVVNLLSHAWADDTLAYIWWGFAGLAIGTYGFRNGKKHHGSASR